MHARIVKKPLSPEISSDEGASEDDDGHKPRKSCRGQTPWDFVAGNLGDLKNRLSDASQEESEEEEEEVLSSPEKEEPPVPPPDEEEVDSLVSNQQQRPGCFGGFFNRKKKKCPQPKKCPEKTPSPQQLGGSSSSSPAASHLSRKSGKSSGQASRKSSGQASRKSSSRSPSIPSSGRHRAGPPEEDDRGSDEDDLSPRRSPQEDGCSAKNFPAGRRATATRPPCGGKRSSDAGLERSEDEEDSSGEEDAPPML